MRIGVLVGLLGVCVVAAGQTTKEELLRDVNQAGGVYLAYREPEVAETVAPEGYEAFYVSMYARHGSRYLIGDGDYRWVLDAMRGADEAGALSVLGRDVLGRLERLWPVVEGRGGDLSPVGERQHRGLAERMYGRWPGVFGTGRRVSARSTLVPRCAMSMAAFGSRLQGLAPGLEIRYEASRRYMGYMSFKTEEAKAFGDNERGPWVADYKRFEREKVRPERFVGALFEDGGYVRERVDGAALMWGFYWIAVDMQDIECGEGFYDLFTGDELFDLWQVNNYNFYVHDANHAYGKGVVVASAKSLVRNIIESADEAIRDTSVAATLRFGHDGNIIPLLALMGVEDFGVSVAKPEECSGAWCDFKAAPMAANLQMVFYRNGAGEVIVKFLHNEREVHVGVGTEMFPYYRWEDVRAYYMGVVGE